MNDTNSQKFASGTRPEVKEWHLLFPPSLFFSCDKRPVCIIFPNRDVLCNSFIKNILYLPINQPAHPVERGFPRGTGIARNKMTPHNHAFMVLKKILIIDDEKELCELLEFYFSKKNFEVHTHQLLEDGLAAIDRFAPCHVFLDNNLPDGLGWERIQELIEKYPGISLHLLSGYNYSALYFPKEAHIKVWQKPISYEGLDHYFK